ncbi:GNAT family N-acetyltransferase [Rhodococcus erythropolis]|uniref:helix-turn-helix domain-containing GNAT family N-acetyltransferase n=1 Tax=Rhodococcus erythropolis TaxID=1833 RepID=UPI00038DBFB5|nr:GNAT family N-acetyltransferase [Rhodococcus erythropolis]AGT92970.1 ArsR family transcriptional regulator [Rhodococcus erythropolis CCM2595]MCQ4128454.1 GNAT family N-acetyltransferase [Rhodococcus erythropolis]MCS4257156.1 phosphinothricin acetyltransferase [Rhodococcus erythropolis]MCW2430950.1 phosphinothricin acetyltransferase [Rhodococcus erythropolis]SUE12684.1 ArsR family transcriptional regulator [Rhodococcus erythropolis]
MSSETLAPLDTDVLARRFACLGDPTRLRVLRLAAGGPIDVDTIAHAASLEPSALSAHLEALIEVGFVEASVREGTSVVSVAGTAYSDLMAAAAVVAARGPVEDTLGVLPDDVVLRRMESGDWDAVRSIYREGIDTGTATFTTSVPSAEKLEAQWLPDHRWVAEIDGRVEGWASLSPVSSRDCYRGVAENSIYIGSGARGRGVGKLLLRRQVQAADASEIWTVQSSIFPENRASVALHQAVGFRIVGTRSRIAQLGGRWRDTLFLERRSEDADIEDADI